MPDNQSVLSEIVIEEISGVDIPAMEGAKICMMKRYKQKGDDMDKNKEWALRQVEKEELAEKKEEEKLIEKNETVRKEELIEKSVEDPVMYITDAGVPMRKSAGDLLISLSKANDELHRRVNASEKIIAQEKLEKRASIIFKSIQGTPEQKAALLKAIETLDEKTKEWALRLIRSKNAAMEKVFEVTGFSGENELSSNIDEMQELTKNLLEKNPGMSEDQAYFNILDTSAGAELYDKNPVK